MGARWRIGAKLEVARARLEFRAGRGQAGDGLGVWYRGMRGPTCVSPIAVAGVQGMQRGSQEWTKTHAKRVTFLLPFCNRFGARGDNYVRE